MGDSTSPIFTSSVKDDINQGIGWLGSDLAADIWSEVTNIWVVRQGSKEKVQLLFKFKF